MLILCRYYADKSNHTKEISLTVCYYCFNGAVIWALPSEAKTRGNVTLPNEVRIRGNVTLPNKVRIRGSRNLTLTCYYMPNYERDPLIDLHFVSAGG